MALQHGTGPTAVNTEGCTQRVSQKFLQNEFSICVFKYYTLPIIAWCQVSAMMPHRFECANTLTVTCDLCVHTRTTTKRCAWQVVHKAQHRIWVHGISDCFTLTNSPPHLVSPCSKGSEQDSLLTSHSTTSVNTKALPGL